MTLCYVELSGVSRELGRAEAESAAAALGGGPASGSVGFDSLVSVLLPDTGAIRHLAGRLGLARRCLRPLARGPEILDRIAAEGRRGESAAVRRLGSPGGAIDPSILLAGRRYVDGGGRIDLGRPDHRYWLGADVTGEEWLFEEIGEIDRNGIAARRMPRMPFQRPVSLPPRLARTAANLARIRSGDRVLDPFLGTGALLAEAGLLGGQMFGIDRDAEMVRGALRNLDSLGLAAETVLEGDAGVVDFETEEVRFESILTDPPYGRSSTTGGESADDLVARVLPRWARRVVPGGRIVLVVPQTARPLPMLGEPEFAASLRVHRSLTREFRVYRVANRTAR